MSPLGFIAFYVLVSIAAFLVGLRFFRMSESPANITPDQAHRFGRLLMMAAVSMLVFLAALAFHGDLKGIRAVWS